MFPRNTHEYIESDHWLIPREELPKPVALCVDNVYWLGMLVGRVMSADESVDGRPLIHAMYGNQYVEFVGGIDCQWSPDPEALEHALGIEASE